MPELEALAGVSIHRPAALAGVELAVAQPTRRRFPPRLSHTLGLCVKSGPGHLVHSDGRAGFFPADGICVRPPRLVWECSTETNGFISLDIPEELLGNVTFGSRMAYGGPRAVPRFLGLAERLLGCDSRLHGEQIVAELLAELAALGVLRLCDGMGAGAVQAACGYIAEHATQRPGLEEIAAAAGIGKFGLIRAFRRELGITPHVYRVLHQLDHGRERIAAGQSIAAASQEAGFFDQAHMSRWFRRVYGITPAQYARQTKRQRGQFPTRLRLG